MTTKAIKTTSIVLGCVVAIIAVAYIFREGLLRAGVNMFLEGDVAVDRLQGVEFGSSHAGINELELSLGLSGQQLIVSSIELDFSRAGFFSMPVVENLTIASAQLLNGNADARVPDENPDSQDSALLISDLLQQLLAFPIARMELRNLELPQFRQMLALNMQKQAGALELRVASGDLQLLINLMQADTASAAQLVLSLRTDEAEVARAELSLEPNDSGYELDGSGKVEFSDANTPLAEYLTTPLPFSSVALEWELAAEARDEILRDPLSSISVGVLQGSILTLRENFVPGLGELALVFPASAELSLAPGAEMSITGTIPLSLAGSWQGQALQSAITLTPSACALGGSQECSIGFDGTASLAGYTVAGTDPEADITLNTLEFNGSGSGKISSEFFAATLNPGSRLGSGVITGPAYSIQSVSIANDSALVVSSSRVETRMTVGGEQVSATVAELGFGEYQATADFSLRGIELVSSEKFAGKMTVQTEGLALTGPQWMPVIGLDADISIDGDVFAFSTPLLLPNAPADPQLQSSGSYDLEMGTGHVAVKLPELTLTGTGNSLSSYLAGWPYSADVMTGTLALDLDMQLQPGTAVAEDATEKTITITGSTKIELTDVAGFYEENFFRGLNTTIDAAYDSSALTLPVTTPPLSITVDELNVGMPVTDIMLDYQLDADSQIVNISSISGKLLDGTVSGSDIKYDFSKERNDMTFIFSGLRLERMMELSEYEGIEAIGAVSGELPVTVSAGKVEVAGGTLYAEEPGGSIRYLNAPPAGQGNPAMDLVNQALSNYQFQSLASTINYTPDGELLLGMQLRGHNPDMNGGQAINLNLNISDNIPQLLRSLQAGRAIEDFLQEQYK